MPLVCTDHTFLHNAKLQSVRDRREVLVFDIYVATQRECRGYKLSGIDALDSHIEGFEIPCFMKRAHFSPELVEGGAPMYVVVK